MRPRVRPVDQQARREPVLVVHDQRVVRTVVAGILEGNVVVQRVGARGWAQGSKDRTAVGQEIDRVNQVHVAQELEVTAARVGVTHREGVVAGQLPRDLNAGVDGVSILEIRRDGVERLRRARQRSVDHGGGKGRSAGSGGSDGRYVGTGTAIVIQSVVPEIGRRSLIENAGIDAQDGFRVDGPCEAKARREIAAGRMEALRIGELEVRIARRPGEFVVADSADDQQFGSDLPTVLREEIPEERVIPCAGLADAGGERRVCVWVRAG